MTTLKQDVTPGLRLMEEILRGGESLAQEYPLVFCRGGSGRVVMLSEAGRPRSVCALLARDLIVDGGATRVRVGLIGSVATEPAYRGRGSATRLLGAAESALRAEGCVVALLWADRPDFYERRGYRPIGRELDFPLPQSLIERLPRGEEVRFARPDDARAIHALYLAHPARVERSASDTALLLGCPGMEVLVLERAGAVRAYACQGRGRDLPGTIHEFGGAVDHVLALTRAHLERCERDEGLYLMAPPSAAELVLRLSALGAPPAPGILGLGKVIDRRAVAEILAPRIQPAGALTIEDKIGLPEPIVRLTGPTGAGDVSDDVLITLLAAGFGMQSDLDFLAESFGLQFDGLPLGLFAWGLDGI